jgi:hypothetical protein
MLVIGLILSVFGVGILCWLLFTLAVYALPFYVGLSAAFAAYHSGASAIGAIVVGFLAATAMLMISQFVFASVPSRLVCSVFALPFIAPAAVAGFYMTLGLAHVVAPSPIWCDIFATIGALCVGCTAFARMRAMAVRPGCRQPVSAVSLHSTKRAATRQG